MLKIMKGQLNIKILPLVHETHEYNLLQPGKVSQYVCPIISYTRHLLLAAMICDGITSVVPYIINNKFRKKKKIKVERRQILP